ncbi:hypothetical protein OH76DRAFT_213933 [Lentinus brumalis]|uniref:Uncharacterized protein n=1 Tax=Lentinus brumalis TaxID=2498619 RepID=A0A371CMH2_9APHY|nr:hypothetical protein OH76DRAFT_213933 [Polyporus brumalis]
MEGAAIEGVLIVGRLTGSEGTPLVGSASTGALMGALAAGIEGAAMGSPEGMVTGRLIAGASADRPRGIDGTLTDGALTGRLEGALTGRLEGAATGRLIAGSPLDGMTDGAPTSGLTEGAPTPLTGSEGIAGTPERNNSTNSEDDNSRKGGELRGEHGVTRGFEVQRGVLCV